MGKITKHSYGIESQRIGPAWFPPLWLHRFIDKYIRRRKTFIGRHRILAAPNVFTWVQLIDEDGTSKMFQNPDHASIQAWYRECWGAEKKADADILAGIAADPDAAELTDEQLSRMVKRQPWTGNMHPDDETKTVLKCIHGNEAPDFSGCECRLMWRAGAKEQE